MFADLIGYTRPADPPVDCFYVYPTVSAAPAASMATDVDDKDVLRFLGEIAKEVGRKWS